ncbi:MAG: RES family NAD+ phosphorylase [Sedimenticola sp.]|nr:RES family NAD+ phosphorylase [Sedimenticola sp.]
MDIWSACKDAVIPKRLEGELIRVVESQEQIATNALVDNLEEQALLEQLLEVSKPPAPPETSGLDYLLASPFRYPPLRHGSRFGTRHEASLFYGALDLSAALAETAFYRLVFWSGMALPPPGGKLTTEHTVFGAHYRVERGLRLHDEPFLPFQDQLTNPGSYVDTQRLGQQLRTAAIDAFEYRSARDPEHGINIALFHGRAFANPKPVWKQFWLCDIRPDGVAFYNKAYGTRQYQRELFLVDGELPAPSV